MKKIGILGGGQLGLMLYQAALSYPATFYFLDPNADCPCAKISPNFVQGDFDDYDTVLNFGKNMDVVSIEIEQVNTKALRELQKMGKRVIPDPEVLEMIKNKRKQKQFYLDNGLPTSPFVEGSSFPFVAKQEEGGYDGKGVEVIDGIEKKSVGFTLAYLLEEKADIKMELSVLVLKTAKKTIVSPIVEQVFNAKYNLVDYLISPAQIPNEIEVKVKEIAIKMSSKLKGEGLFAIEFFWNNDDSLWINEIAPRLHNSGHVGMEAWNFSQFDALARLLIGLDTSELWFCKQDSAMINLIGNVEKAQNSPFVENIQEFQLDNSYLHWYQKDISKAGRKMGHLNIINKSIHDLKLEIDSFKHKLERIKI